jgi:hypothetical protein
MYAFITLILAAVRGVCKMLFECIKHAYITGIDISQSVVDSAQQVVCAEFEKLISVSHRYPPR